MNEKARAGGDRTNSFRTNGKRPKAVTFLYVLLVFLGVGAIAGGVGLITDPSGGQLGMSVDEMLKRSPFDDFLIPGILLLVVFGLLPLLVVYGLVRRPQWSWADAINPFKELHATWTLALYVGFGQIIWIMVETYIMDAVAVIHVLYMTIGLLIQIAALLPSCQRYFRVPPDVDISDTAGGITGPRSASR